MFSVGHAAWTDTLTIYGTVTTGQWDLGGSPGFWKNWDSNNTYTQQDIEDWLAAIDDDSDWLGPTTVAGMEAVCYDGEGGTAEEKFLRAYLAVRLDVASGRLNETTVHDFSGYDPGNYLGLAGSGNLPQIIAAIEGKYSPTPPTPPSPTDSEFLTMKNILQALYSLWI